MGVLMYAVLFRLCGFDKMLFFGCMPVYMDFTWRGRRGIRICILFFGVVWWGSFTLMFFFALGEFLFRCL